MYCIIPGSVLEVDIFSEDGVAVGTVSDSDTDLDVYVYEGETIQICGVIDLDEYEIDSDLNITVPLSIEFPKKLFYAGRFYDYKFKCCASDDCVLLISFSGI